MKVTIDLDASRRVAKSLIGIAFTQTLNRMAKAFIAFNSIQFAQPGVTTFAKTGSFIAFGHR